MLGTMVALRFGVGALAVVGSVALVGCGGGGGGGADDAQAAAPGATATVTPERNTRVTVGDNIFQPVLSSISVGKTIDWAWEGNVAHSIVMKTPDGKEVKSPEQTKGTFSFKFEAAGTYDYQCGVHGDRMQGRVMVSQ